MIAVVKKREMNIKNEIKIYLKNKIDREREIHKKNERKRYVHRKNKKQETSTGSNYGNTEQPAC